MGGRQDGFVAVPLEVDVNGTGFQLPRSFFLRSSPGPRARDVGVVRLGKFKCMVCFLSLYHRREGLLWYICETQYMKRIAVHIPQKKERM